MSKIGVGGGAGFIGSHLVDKLLAEGHEVFVIDDFSGGNLENLKDSEGKYKVDWYEIDCRDAKAVDAVFAMTKPEIFYALQANAAENKAQFSPIDVTSRNYSAFINTLTSFIRHGGKKFIFTSSIAVYGAGQTPFQEATKPQPEDLYGITKLAAEKTLEVMSKVHGFEYIIARPHNVYGPRQNMKDPYRNVVTIWMNAILRGEPVYIYGDGAQIRQFSYIDDVTSQLVQCLDATPNQIFNIGNDKQYSLSFLFHEIQKATSYKTDPKYLPLRPQEVMTAVAEHLWANALLPIEKTDLATGLAATWEWVKEQGPQVPEYGELELVNDKVPANWLKK